MLIFTSIESLDRAENLMFHLQARLRKSNSYKADTLTLSQPGVGGGADYDHPLALFGLKNSVFTPLQCSK